MTEQRPKGSERSNPEEYLGEKLSSREHEAQSAQGEHTYDGEMGASVTIER